MSNQDKPLPISDHTASSQPTRRRLPRWLIIYLAIVILVVAVLNTFDVAGDAGLVNVLNMLLGIVSALVLYIWVCRFSPFSRQARRGVFFGVLLTLSAAIGTFRLDHVSGDMIPTFVFRWSPTPDTLLKLPPKIADAGGKIEPLTATADDFPQFLGPERTTAVERTTLDRDWTARPPKKLWRHAIGAGWSAFSVVHGHAVTLEQRGNEELVTCYNVTSGELEWANTNPGRFEHVAGGIGPRSTPTIDNGLVYALGATGLLQCLDGTTGECRWKKDLLKEFEINPKDDLAMVAYGRSNSPLVVDEMVIVPAGGPRGGPMVSLVAYNKLTGAEVWRGGTWQISYASPAVATVAGVRQVLSVNETCVSGHDVKSGKVLWEYPWKADTATRPNVSQAFALPPDRILISRGYGQGGAVFRLTPKADVFSADTVWQNRRVMKTKFTNVAIKDGYSYGLSDGILECVDLANGNRMWRSGKYDEGQILRVGGLLLVMAESGEVFLVEATPKEENHVLGRFQAIEGMTWNNLALAGPYLLVRNGLEAACYELPLTKE